MHSKHLDAPSNDFTGHGRLCNVDERFPPERVDLDAQLVHHEFARFSACKPIPGNDCRGVDLYLYEFICASQELGGDDDNGCSTVTDFLVLLLGEIDKDSAGGMFDFKETEDSRAVVRDGHLLRNRRVKHGWNKMKQPIGRTPMLSTSILSSPRGPRELLTMFAMD